MVRRIRAYVLQGLSTSERQAKDRRGFTLVELMITLTVLAVVMVVLMTVMYAAQRSRANTSNSVESAQAARVALDLLSRDLRSAGYGADLYTASPQPPIAYIDSMQVLINANFSPWPDDTVPKPPLAYNPLGTPQPFPLQPPRPWMPPMKYRRGAETVRWTLDLDNNGLVNAADISNANGLDAQRTPNPNDYVLVRQVYGDSTNNMVNNNGGQMERIALVRRPGGGVPPMFRVYLQGQTTFYDWSNGPLLPGELANIERIEITVVAPSGRPNSKGVYAETRLTTEVNSIRNIPTFGRKEYTVDGYVFDDLDQSYSRDALLEPGLAGSVVRLGQYSTTTNAAGYFVFRVPAGSYVLRHFPPAGYGVWTSPDSTIITVPPMTSFSFADTARAGGWVDVFTYHDAYGDGAFDAADAPLEGVEVAMASTGQKIYTDVAGKGRLFAPVGGYSISATPPDSFVTTTPNPVTGSMVDGGSANHEFGLSKTEVGTVRGKVFRDNDRDGIWDGGEAGIANVWVGVTSDGGVSILSYKYTDAAGDYELTVPANDPPHTTPYQILAIVPPGYYSTGTTALGPLWVTANSITSNQNFGMLGYTIITLNASRVLSLASGDVVEKQGSDNGSNGARYDSDIVLGADAGGTDNVSVWFNQYDNTPVFDPNASYTRNAPQSVMSISIDTLDTASPKRRLDLVTGTKNATAGNFFVWFNQNSGGNEGYFPLTYNTAYRTSNNGDVQAVLTADVCGSSTADQVDIIVGSKSSTAGQGSVEIWASNNAATPTYTRLETYPGAGGMSTMGEVNAMALIDFDNDGLKDLVIGTRKSDFAGELHFLRNNGKTSGSSRFTLAATYDPGGIVTAITAFRVDGDALRDVIIGVQTGLATADLQQWSNTSVLGSLNFTHARTVAAPGLVMSLANGDYGGLSGRNDLAMGWRQDPSSYVGGVLIYSMDVGLLINNGADPSAGSVKNMVPALTVNNFNFGVQPVTPSPPYLTDLAAGIKVSATTGALVVFIR